MTLLQALVLFSAVSFLMYGFRSLTTEAMKAEFERYGLAKFRVLTGSLEIIGALGLLVGLFFHPLLIIAAAGLSLLMLLGFGTRLVIKDPFLQCLPSFIFLLVNAYILYLSLQSFNH